MHAPQITPDADWDDGSRRVCTRCVMSDTDPDITFDAEGRCNHCTDYLDRIANLTYKPGASDRELAAIVERIKAAGRKKEYDCVIGVSGGIDSCYAAYVVKNLGLRPLVVHMDNGWNSDTAVKNIKNVARALGIDYQSVVLDWEEFRDLQLAFLRASVPEIETPTDIAIPAALHGVAAEHRVRYVIMGGNYATEGILPRAWHYNAKDVRFLKAVNRRFGSGKLGSFPTFGFVKETYYKVFKRIRLVYVLNLVPYTKTEAMRKLQEDLGWEYYGGKHYESKITGFVQSYILPVKFKIDYRRATLVEPDLRRRDLPRRGAGDPEGAALRRRARAAGEGVRRQEVRDHPGGDGRHPGGATEDASRLPEQREAPGVSVRGVPSIRHRIDPRTRERE